MGKVNDAVVWALSIANDNSHGYDQGRRWGPDYDCSSMVIQAYENAGIPVKTKGATYTGNMYSVFTACGFKDVTSQVNLSTGAGLRRGDVCLNHIHHVEMAISGTQLVGAHANENGGASGGKTGDQTGGEICVRNYYNYPWNCVLRHPDGGSETPTVSKEDTVSKNAYLTKAEMQVNATYIAQRLLAEGWSLNAIAGLLGNMQGESTINPGIWENLDSSQPDTLGRGLVGWTPGSRVNNWASARGLDPADIDTQINMLMWEVTNDNVYFKTSSYPTPATFEAFTTSTETPEYLAQAFMYNYERPYSLNHPERSEYARYWYDYLCMIEPDGGEPVRKRHTLPLWMMVLATRRKV